MKHFSLRAGFTFIELLVTMALIALIVGVATVSYIQTSKSGRDSRRQQDLAAIQAALEFYKLENGTYPECQPYCAPNGSTNWIPDLTSEYISAVPMDPREDLSGSNLEGGAAQTYNYESDGTYTYQLRAWLESGSGSLYVVNSPQ